MLQNIQTRIAHRHSIRIRASKHPNSYCTSSFYTYPCFKTSKLVVYIVILCVSVLQNIQTRIAHRHSIRIRASKHPNSYCTSPFYTYPCFKTSKLVLHIAILYVSVLQNIQTRSVHRHSIRIRASKHPNSYCTSSFYTYPCFKTSKLVLHIVILYVSVLQNIQTRIAHRHSIRIRASKHPNSYCTSSFYTYPCFKTSKLGTKLWYN